MDDAAAGPVDAAAGVQPAVAVVAHHPARTYPSLYDSTATTIVAVVLGLGIIVGIQAFVARMFSRARDEYAALTMVLLRLLPFKRPGAATLPVASAAPVLHTAPAGGAAEPLKKPESPAPAPSPAPALALPVQPTALGHLWAECVQSLVAAELVTGLVRELALQSELQSQDSGTWRLRVESPSLNQGEACQALLLALQSLPSLPNQQHAERLQVEIGPATDTPARRHAALMAERQQQAEQLIDQDPLVQDMVRNWGARIVPGSVRMQAAAPVTAQAKPI